MSTRATYRINGQYFYTHYDGHESGAAERFAAMIENLTRPDDNEFHAVAERRGGLAFAFIRGNDDVEPTESHEAHGDTEFRYDVNEMRDSHGQIAIRVYKRGSESDQWRMIAEEELCAWLDGQRRDLTRHLASCRKRFADNKRLFADVFGDGTKSDAAIAEESIPLVCRALHGDPALAWRRYEYATTKNAQAIAVILRRFCNNLGDGNPNRPSLKTLAEEWETAAQALVDGGSIAPKAAAL